MNNEDTTIGIIGIIVAIVLSIIEYFFPRNISLLPLMGLVILVVIYMIYIRIKQKLELVENMNKKIIALEEKLNFINHIHELDKRIILLEKENVKQKR